MLSQRPGNVKDNGAEELELRIAANKLSNEGCSEGMKKKLAEGLQAALIALITEAMAPRNNLSAAKTFSTTPVYRRGMTVSA